MRGHAPAVGAQPPRRRSRMFIAASHARSDAAHGAPRVHEDLHEPGHRVGRKRAARFTRAAELVGVGKTGAAPRPMRTVPEMPQAPDLVRRIVTATAPTQCGIARPGRKHAVNDVKHGSPDRHLAVGSFLQRARLA